MNNPLDNQLYEVAQLLKINAALEPNGITKWKKLKNVTAAATKKKKFVQLEFNFEDNKEDHDR